MAAAIFLAYAVWGSLFPFDFREVRFATAAARFWRPLRTPVSEWSIADLGSNLLLFVPIGLFLTAALESAAPSRAARAIAPAVFLVAVLLSTILEFGQAFVRWRTPSVVDVIAEALGAVVGLTVWRSTHARLDAALGAAIDEWQRAAPVQQILLFYCGVFAWMWLLPFDFTLRPDEIADKYLHQRLLLPFTPSPDAASPVRLAIICAAAVPLGIAAAMWTTQSTDRRGREGGKSDLAVVASSLILLELVQIFVFTRTTDGTELFAALIGAGAGAVVASRGQTGPDPYLTPTIKP